MRSTPRLCRERPQPFIDSDSIQDDPTLTLMKIRIYTPFLPFPPSEGGLQHIFNQIDALAQLGNEIETVCWLNSPLAVKGAIEKNPAAWNSKVKILCFQEKTLHARTAAEWAEISPDQLAAKDPVGFSAWDRGLRVVSSLVGTGASPENYYFPIHLDRRADIPQTDLDIFHYSFSYNWLSKRSIKTARKTAVYFQNIESDLFGIRAEKENFLPFKLVHQLNQKKLKAHEKAIERFADEIWQVSPKDHEQLQIPAEKTHRIVGPVFAKNILEHRRNLFYQFLKTDSNKAPKKINLGFIGGTDYEPNRIALEWIIQKLCPLLNARHFDGELLVVGKQTSHHLKNLATPFAFVKFLGFLPSLEDWWSSLNFMLVPDLTGAGVRIKLLESVASGLPVITHPMASERCHPLVSESPLVCSRLSAAEWTDEIMSPTASEKRKLLSELEFNRGISGEYTYEFLKDSSFLKS